jgi:exodeoxyribonuclease III
MKSGFMDWFKATNPDILNLQEIRVEWNELDATVQNELSSNYDVCWFPATSKKGYAGAATLTRKGLGFVHTKGLGISEYDVEGRMIVSEGANFTLLAGYFPNASQGLVRLPLKQQFATDLAACVKARHKKGQRVVVVGDMNVAPEEIDLANPKTNRKNPGFTDEEREGFRGYLNTGLVDVLRERHPGEKGLYSWWSHRGDARAKNVGWRIDIFLVSKDLMSHVSDAAIHADVTGSDHCPVSLTMKF